MPTKVRELSATNRPGDRAACGVCREPRRDEIPACDVWERSLRLANGLPALKR